MFDRDIAMMYETETRTINQQVKRNAERFDEGVHSFKLNEEEFDEFRKILKSQNATSSWGGVRKPPSTLTQNLAKIDLNKK
ncbi:MAG: ORF6N domain-containing protein [Bacteroidales bacterium]|nr:ORF6N domain-containing protein [Bacteroidales bacterium]